MTENLPNYIVIDEYQLNDYYKKGYVVKFVIPPNTYTNNQTISFNGTFMGNPVNMTGSIPVVMGSNARFLMELEGAAKILYGEKREQS